MSKNHGDEKVMDVTEFATAILERVGVANTGAGWGPSNRLSYATDLKR